MKICKNLSNDIHEMKSLTHKSAHLPPSNDRKTARTFPPNVMGTQWLIQDFPERGAPTPNSAIILQFFAENCIKMKKIGPPGGGARPWRPLGPANGTPN